MVSKSRRHIPGIWYPSRSSKNIPASLNISGNQITVTSSEDDQILARNDLKDVAVSDRVGAIARRITFIDGAAFETWDNDLLDEALPDMKKTFFGKVHFLERFHPRLIALSGAVLITLVVLYRLALPLLVEVAVYATPTAVPAAMSSGTMDMLDRTVFRKTSLPDERRQVLTQNFEKIAFHGDHGEKGYSLLFRDGGAIGANAFALPDGTIVLTDQLSEWAGDDVEMLMGVLAHEIGHVDGKHSLRQMYRMMGTAGLLLLIAGDLGSGVEELLTQGAALLSLGYSREAELEADRYSVMIMKKAGRNPEALVRFFVMLEKKAIEAPGLDIFSTHPNTPERKRLVLQHNQDLEKQDLEKKE